MAVVLTWSVPLLVIGLVYPIATGNHVVTAGAPSALIRWISPIRPLMTLLSADRTSAVPLTLLTAASAAILVAALFTTRAVTDRRE